MKSKEISEFTTLIPKRCYHCGVPIGVMTDTHIFIGLSRFSKAITFDCVACGKGNFWKSDKEKIKDNK